MIRRRGDKTAHIQSLAPHFMDRRSINTLHRLRRLLIRLVANRSGEQPILIEVGQRRIVDIRIEIHPVMEPFGIRIQPTAQSRDIKAPPEVDQTIFRPLRSKPP